MINVVITFFIRKGTVTCGMVSSILFIVVDLCKEIKN